MLGSWGRHSCLPFSTPGRQECLPHSAVRQPSTGNRIVLPMRRAPPDPGCLAMPVRRSLYVLTLLLLSTAAARADELRTLDNKTIQGTTVEVTDKEVVMKKAEGGEV